MALRNILKSGEPRLRKLSREVTDYNERLHQLLDDMRETLLDAGGVGLAAPQVGVLKRIVVIDVDYENPYDKAGAYAIQGFFGKYISHINGDYYNVMGLPLCKICQEIKKF